MNDRSPSADRSLSKYQQAVPNPCHIPTKTNFWSGTKGSNFHLIGICFVGKQCNISKSIYIGLREDGGGWGAAENATKTPFKLKIKNLKGKGSKCKDYGEQQKGHLESCIQEQNCLSGP